MRRGAVLFSLLILMYGCGDKAPDTAVVTGPSNSSTALDSAVPIIYRALDFTVANVSGDPLPDVEIEFFAGGIGILTDLNGVTLGTGVIYKTTTDERGVARVSYSISIAACSGTEDQVTVGSVHGTVASADHLWTTTITLSCS